MTAFDLNPYLKCRRNPQIESDLARQLRLRPEGERFAIVDQLLTHNLTLGLHVAPRVLRGRHWYETILDRGVREADASSIKWWLECVVKGMGFLHTIHRLKLIATRDPEGVENAAYFLPSFRQSSGYAQTQVDAVRAACKVQRSI